MRCFILFLLSFNCFSQNLIPNPSFEAGNDSTSAGWNYIVNGSCGLYLGNGAPDNWYVIALTPDRIKETQNYCIWDYDTAAFGAYYIVIGYDESCGTTFIEPLQAGFTYKLSYYAKPETLHGFAGNTSQLNISFTSPSGNLLQSPVISYAHWQRIEHVFIATANSTQMEITGAMFNGGTCIDSIALVQIASALPIQLTSFKAKLKRDAVLLTWSTASEVNNDYFEVQRSRNGYEFTTVGKVNGAGNSTTERHYYFKVTGYNWLQIETICYFRLKQVDYDGNFSFSKIIYVRREEDYFELLKYNLLGQEIK